MADLEALILREIRCAHHDEASARRVIAALREAGLRVVKGEPDQMTLLTLALLSAAGPQSRAQYIEAWQELVRAADLLRGEESDRHG